MIADRLGQTYTEQSKQQAISIIGMLKALVFDTLLPGILRLGDKLTEI